MEKTEEYCPHCDEYVEVDAELKVVTCPNCGKRIVVCSMCRACDSGNATGPTGFCTNCCLDYQAKVENGEIRDRWS